MSAEGPLLLEIHTAARRYLAPRAHLDHLSRMSWEDEPPAGQRPRPLISCELGPLLDPADLGLPGRRHALTLELRRRTVALLVTRVEALGSPGAVQPLGPMLARRLARPWVLGAVVIGDEPVIVLDLRRIATDVALGAV